MYMYSRLHSFQACSLGSNLHYAFTGSQHTEPLRGEASGWQLTIHGHELKANLSFQHFRKYAQISEEIKEEIKLAQTKGFKISFLKISILNICSKPPIAEYALRKSKLWSETGLVGALELRVFLRLQPCLK